MIDAGCVSVRRKEFVRFIAKEQIVAVFKFEVLKFDRVIWDGLVNEGVQRICKLPPEEFDELLALYPELC